MSKHGVVVYGASGYTGKLICWHLAQAGIAFTAAGRNAERLQEQMDLVPELAGAEYECRAVDRTVEDLAELFAGSKVVVNVTGPFMQIGEPVVQAALQAGCHYLDTTGEQDWITHIRDEYGEAFANKGLLLAPATSYMFVMGAMAAEIALETPGIDTLDIAYLADTMTSVASTKSFLRMCTKPQYFLEQNELVMWPYATPYDIRVPDSNRIFRALPWSGGAEPLWFRDDPRVRNCSVLIGFRSQAMFGAVIDTLRNFEQPQDSRGAGGSDQRPGRNDHLRGTPSRASRSESIRYLVHRPWEHQRRLGRPAGQLTLLPDGGGRGGILPPIACGCPKGRGLPSGDHRVRRAQPDERARRTGLSIGPG